MHSYLCAHQQVLSLQIGCPALVCPGKILKTDIIQHFVQFQEMPELTGSPLQRNSTALLDDMQAFLKPAAAFIFLDQMCRNTAIPFVFPVFPQQQLQISLDMLFFIRLCPKYIAVMMGITGKLIDRLLQQNHLMDLSHKASVLMDGK